MKTSMLSAITVLLLAFTFTSDAVQVQEGVFSFSAESVRTLQALTTTNSAAAEQRSPRLPSPGALWVCQDPELPLDFLPLCQQPGAAMALSNLLVVPMDVCEICSFAACTGC